MKLAFLFTLIAGFSTMIGTLLIFLNFKNINKIIYLSLTFASLVMFFITITDLIPESIRLISLNNNQFKTIFLCLIFIILGIIISMIIDYFLPERNIKNNKLFRVGIISMLVIILHNIPEGIATFLATKTNVNLGLSMTIAIALHNIPEGITISIPIYYATRKKNKAIFYTFISALSEPFGAIITYLFLVNYINNIALGLLLAIISGIMLQIVFCELLPTAKEYKIK